MIRTIESIQKDIAETVREIQDLRRTQAPTWNEDFPLTTRRIHALTLKLDALYAEKRAAQSPAPPAGVLHVERRQPSNAAERLIDRLFQSLPPAN